MEGTHLLPIPGVKKAAAAGTPAAAAAAAATAIAPWEVHLLASTVGAAARARVTARHAAATGSVNLTALTRGIRRAFASGRRAPGKGRPRPRVTRSFVRKYNEWSTCHSFIRSIIFQPHQLWYNEWSVRSATGGVG